MGSKKRKRKDHLLDSYAISTAHQLHEAGDLRSCVLVGCAMVESQVEVLLRYHFSSVSEATSELIRNLLDGDNKNPQALLSSGWAKATIALVTGAIDRNTYDLYNEIRKLRNDFAHHPGPIRLPKKIVAPMVALLDAVEKESLEGVLSQRQLKEPLWGYIEKTRYSEARLCFMQCCLLLNHRIYAKRELIQNALIAAKPASDFPARRQP